MVLTIVLLIQSLFFPFLDFFFLNFVMEKKRGSYRDDEEDSLDEMFRLFQFISNLYLQFHQSELNSHGGDDLMSTFNFLTLSIFFIP